MSDKTLKQWAGDHDIEYWTAWRDYQNNKIEGAYKSATGRIYVKEIQEPQQVIKELTAQNKQSITSIPNIKFENISLADSTINTRVNKAADSPIVNRFSAIDEGIVPWTAQSGAYNRSSITTRDCVILCQKAFFNISVFSQIIKLLVYLGAGNINFKGGTKKSRDFFNAYFRKIGLNGPFQIQWFLEFWRSGNVFAFSYDKELKREDVNQITNIYGLDTANASKKVTIPAQFTILNPADVQVGVYSMFIRPLYYKILSGYELEVLKNPKTDSDKEVYDSLPQDAKDAIKKKARMVKIELPSENLLASFFFKMPYEGLAIPPFFSVLDDINWKLQLRKMDIALTRMLNQAILLVTTGAEPEKGGINYNNITSLQQIFLNESVGRVLVADYTTKAQFIIPEISTILDPKKYEAVNNDIYIGLNYILLQGEKFANKQTALQLFIENVRFARKVFIQDFLSKVIEKVSKELGFKSYPEPYFDDISIENTGDRDRIITQLAQFGQLSPKEVFEALESGRLPVNYDDSVENQKEYKSFRDKGLYQPVIGGPANQMQLLDKTNENQMQVLDKQQSHDKEMLDKQNEHDAKQKSADRKHAKENPQAPAPQIVLNTPTKLKQPSGRPTGSGTPQKTKKIRPLGASLISGKKVIENTLLYSKLEHNIIHSLLKKHKLKSLTDNQLTIAQELTKLVARNEESTNWDNKDIISEYINKPLDKNLERIEKINELSAFHQIETNLGSIIYNSIIEDKEENKGGE